MLLAGPALGQVPSAAPPASLPPAGYPAGVLPRLVPADPAAVGQVMTFQKPAGADQPARPTPPAQTPPGGAPEAGKGTTAGAKDEPPPPSPVSRERAFRLNSDAKLNERIVDELIQEAKARQAGDQGVRVKDRTYYEYPQVFPVAPAGVTYVPKTASYPPARIAVDPSYVTHSRLYFEDLNTERYGWDLGIVQPLLSAGTFYKDIFLLPAKYASHPHERYETSAGKCRPGDPVPYSVYPPEIDIWGYAAQATTLVGAGFVFPY